MQYADYIAISIETDRHKPEQQEETFNVLANTYFELGEYQKATDYF